MLLLTSFPAYPLPRLDRQIAKRVVLAIDRLAEGDPRVNILKLSGVDEYRLRAGEWRVRFRYDKNANEVIVLRILPRGRAYDR